MIIEGYGMDQAWWTLLVRLIKQGEHVAPRGQAVREILDVELRLQNPTHNILAFDERKLNYRFMIAEWLYIWFGHDDVKTIAQFNPNIAQFSDNGVDFNGAYGPPITGQWDRVKAVLEEDHDTRQAVILIYRPPTGPTKDVACTLTIQFLRRKDLLHAIVNMRSSDAWLGVPYDVFNFTMLQNIMAAQLGIGIGTFHIHFGSSHLYERNLEAAQSVLKTTPGALVKSPVLYEAPPTWLNVALSQQLDVRTQDSKDPWTTYNRVLLASNREARELLITL